MKKLLIILLYAFLLIQLVQPKDYGIVQKTNQEYQIADNLQKCDLGARMVFRAEFIIPAVVTFVILLFVIANITEFRIGTVRTNLKFRKQLPRGDTVLI